eukprot:2111147-Rhodomonas_salina.6
MLAPYARATICPVLTRRMVLPGYSGTEPGPPGNGPAVRRGKCSAGRRAAYARATECPVLTRVSAYAHSTECPGTAGMGLCRCEALCGSDTARGAAGCDASHHGAALCSESPYPGRLLPTRLLCKVRN